MIITHREFPNEKTYSMDYAGRKLSFTVGKFAELANAAVMTRYGDTTVLVACTAFLVHNSYNPFLYFRF